MINKLLFITIIFILVWITIIVVSQAIRDVIQTIATKDVIAHESLDHIIKLYDVHKIEK